MKKIMTTISALLICVTVLAGCGSDPIQADLLNYVNNQVPTMVDLENTVTTEYSAVKADANATDATFAAKLQDVIIPAENQLIAKAKAIIPATDEVTKLHNEYVTSRTEQLEAFTLMLQAAQNSDQTVMATANDKLTASNTATTQYLADLDALKKAHNIENSK